MYRTETDIQTGSHCLLFGAQESKSATCDVFFKFTLVCRHASPPHRICRSQVLVASSKQWQPSLCHLRFVSHHAQKPNVDSHTSGRDIKRRKNDIFAKSYNELNIYVTNFESHSGYYLKAIGNKSERFILLSMHCAT
ncbi:hypothetical protein EGR_09540 [Echinococcus granulosus]|uniref:Uncharacterized protein n=1 Tax=Echinococcus granulosus TaxID=6210 RepID=W6U3B3_ECHGR|nr:hypothetical protein EGR_09540 [Echinococcus granulosus]EUB55600.1 hypothetical protein EGR_09540 [Echinococcus granulosus]